MTSGLDIYRSTNLLVKQHGEDAPIHAAMRADAMLEAGDLDGYGMRARLSVSRDQGNIWFGRSLANDFARLHCRLAATQGGSKNPAIRRGPS